MPFMEPDVYKSKAWIVETNCGNFIVPFDVESDRDNLADYVEGTIENPEETITEVDGWVGRMSAPGYLDCTDWCFGKTEEEVLEQLRDYYGLDDEEEGEEDLD